MQRQDWATLLLRGLMFFIASKLLWIFAAPVNVALVVALIGAFWGRRGRALAVFFIALLLVMGISPLATFALRTLEDRFPLPSATAPAPYGIIVLGGAIDDAVGSARGQVVLRDGGSRLTEAALLARRFPAARIVYTGGSPGLTATDSNEAQQARDLLVGLGVEGARITLETRSRNTDENARFTADIVKPQPGQIWWIDTSAYHTPRAMGLFRKAGFDAVAYPVDYYTFGDNRDFRLSHDTVGGLRNFDQATHEWIGLMAYWATGKIDALFPAP